MRQNNFSRMCRGQNPCIFTFMAWHWLPFLQTFFSTGFKPSWLMQTLASQWPLWSTCSLTLLSSLLTRIRDQINLTTQRSATVKKGKNVGKKWKTSSGRCLALWYLMLPMLACLSTKIKRENKVRVQIMKARQVNYQNKRKTGKKRKREKSMKVKQTSRTCPHLQKSELSWG